MFTWSHTITSTATPEQVWPLYADVRRWLEWDSGLEAVTLDGPFAVGSTGTLQVEGQPPLTWTLTDVEENALFTDVTEIPGVATLTFVHRIDARPEGSAITVTQAGSETVIIVPYAKGGAGRYGILLFMLCWLGGWTFGEYHAVTELASGRGGLFVLWQIVGLVFFPGRNGSVPPPTPISRRTRGRSWCDSTWPAWR